MSELMSGFSQSGVGRGTSSPDLGVGSMGMGVCQMGLLDGGSFLLVQNFLNGLSKWTLSCFSLSKEFSAPTL